MSGRLASAAMKYCRVRANVGATVSVVLGALLLAGALFANRALGDSDKFVPTAGTVEDAAVSVSTASDGTTRYVVTRTVGYDAGGRRYSARLSGEVFPTDAAARAAARAAVLGRARVAVYYDPSRPSRMTVVPGREDWIAGGMAAVGALLLVAAAVTYALRDNEIMCGVRVASDVGALLDL